MKLVIIIPALNEAPTIASVIGHIPPKIEGIDATEVVVVDDGSTDGTADRAREAGASVIGHPLNRGVGVAFATGVDAALRRGADVIVNMDADGQFDPADIPDLIRPILQGGYGFVTCSRFARSDYVPEMPWARKWGNILMTRLVNRVLWRAHFTDVSCGFRAYSRETALRLNLFGRFTYTQETFIDLASKGVTMAEVPLRVRGVRETGDSRVARSLWVYGVRAGAIILTALRDVRPMSFFGAIGLAVFLFGVLLGLLVFGYWCVTGQTSPIRSVLLGSGTFMTLGFLLAVAALLADMVGRLRITMEEIRYAQRKADYGAGDDECKLRDSECGVERPNGKGPR
jgi:glycosyltransferase involved in cell wall biosynthesis